MKPLERTVNRRNIYTSVLGNIQVSRISELQYKKEFTKNTERKIAEL
jgi:hypothetical protein